jgi:hypothetical protein
MTMKNNFALEAVLLKEGMMMKGWPQKWEMDLKREMAQPLTE